LGIDVKQEVEEYKAELAETNKIIKTLKEELRAVNRKYEALEEETAIKSL
jgi:chromosome segregation ATPase